ncbi:PGPGW domain-containing protein [Nocardiopsis sp. NRRL B-16309]|uniref:PGPGW domain-containing protein n=1 Tax=Nocardiopsis sp. NRRL B-16309 TaxID=1519494 RepID=UPI000A8168CE|nr:PGPGW domain-containing protein [Nocardiopsis sp. NRRL B-16309]
MHTHPALHLPWLILVGTIGTVVILAGLVMMVFPGPGIASVLLGLVILSTEFRWANSLVRPVRVWSRRAERFGQRKKDEYLGRWRARRAARARRTSPRPE